MCTNYHLQAREREREIERERERRGKTGGIREKETRNKEGKGSLAYFIPVVL